MNRFDLQFDAQRSGESWAFSVRYMNAKQMAERRAKFVAVIEMKDHRLLG